jgi:hypothetical protein
LQDYGSDRLSSLFGDAWTKIKGELNLGVLGGKTPAEVAAVIGRNLKEASVFGSIAKRAEAITGLEMGRAFSMAADLRMKKAANYVPGLEKQWVHAGSPKQPRLSHLLLHGAHVPVDEPFDAGGIKIMYPRDPAAPLSEVISCGCDHVPYHSSWGDMELPKTYTKSRVKNETGGGDDAPVTVSAGDEGTKYRI